MTSKNIIHSPHKVYTSVEAFKKVLHSREWFRYLPYQEKDIKITVYKKIKKQTEKNVHTLC